MTQTDMKQAPIKKTTPRQREVLRILATQTSWSVGEVARALGVSYPAATKFAIRLERRGMIKRRQGEGDGRVTRISLTSAGKEQSFPS